MNGNGVRSHSFDSKGAAGQADPQLPGLMSDVDAEQAVLACLILNQDALDRAIERLKPDDFSEGRNRLLFEAAMQLAESNQGVNRLTLARQLSAMRALDQAGGADYLTELTDVLPVIEDMDSYVRLVKTTSLRRQLVNACSHIYAESRDPGNDIDALISSAEESIYEVTQTAMLDQGRFIGARDMIMKTIYNMEARLDQPELFAGLSTGFRELDHMINGLKMGELVIVAGRPGMGKTALALNMAQHATTRDKKSVALFSLEMSSEVIAMRMIAAEGRLNLEDLSRKLTGDMMVQVAEAASSLTDANLEVFDSAKLTVTDMLSHCRRMKRRPRGLDLVIVDYLGLIAPFTRNLNDNQAVRIGEISRSLKLMARELDVPIICVAQLNRETIREQDKRPKMSHLRDSGAIEQDADVILMIHREAYYQQDADPATDRLAELHVVKNRNGRTGVIELHWDGPCNRFDSLDRTTLN